MAMRGAAAQRRVMLGPWSQDVEAADWSDEVAPFWGAVIRSALSAEGIKGLLKAGWTTMKVSVSVSLA